MSPAAKLHQQPRISPLRNCLNVKAKSILPSAISAAILKRPSPRGNEHAKVPRIDQNRTSLDPPATKCFTVVPSVLRTL